MKFDLQEDNRVIIKNRNLKEDFQHEYVIGNFKKLRNIILNTQDEIVRYMMEEKPMVSILDQFKKICEEKDQDDLKYMDVMIAITLKFIKVQYHDEVVDKTS